MGGDDGLRDRGLHRPCRVAGTSMRLLRVYDERADKSNFSRRNRLRGLRTAWSVVVGRRFPGLRCGRCSSDPLPSAYDGRHSDDDRTAGVAFLEGANLHPSRSLFLRPAASHVMYLRCLPITTAPRKVLGRRPATIFSICLRSSAWCPVRRERWDPDGHGAAVATPKRACPLPSSPGWQKEARTKSIQTANNGSTSRDAVSTHDGGRRLVTWLIPCQIPPGFK